MPGRGRSDHAKRCARLRRVGGAQGIAVHRRHRVGRLVRQRQRIFGQHASGGVADRDPLGLERREDRHDAFDSFFDRNHLNMSSTRARAARASFSETSPGIARVLPVRKE